MQARLAAFENEGAYVECPPASVCGRTHLTLAQFINQSARRGQARENCHGVTVQTSRRSAPQQEATRYSRAPEFAGAHNRARPSCGERKLTPPVRDLALLTATQVTVRQSQLELAAARCTANFLFCFSPSEIGKELRLPSRPRPISLEGVSLCNARSFHFWWWHFAVALQLLRWLRMSRLATSRPKLRRV